MKNILVTGATGHLGRSTVDFLVKKGVPVSSISVLVRDEEKAKDLKAKGVTIKIGDYDNYQSLLSAFRNTDKLLFISNSDLINRNRQHENVVKAAKEAGVRHIFYTSVQRKNETASSPLAMLVKSHTDTEQQIKATGIPYTFLRNNVYMDMIPWFAGEKLLESGIFFPAGEGKTGFTSRSDMAEATANVLTGEGHENKDYFFTNPENVSFSDIAGAISQASGKQIPYISPKPEAYVDALTKAQVPAEFIGLFAGFAEGIKQGEFMEANKDLEHLLGRKPATVKEFFAQMYS